jgi:membrane-bound serine protease (ClpP class)
MKKYLYILLTIIFATASSAHADTQTNKQTKAGIAYVIPIHDMIERGLVYLIRRGVTEAETLNANAIIIDMNTPGGRLDATAEIIKILTSTKITTYTFVNSDAISAGAITAMATDHIYMAPGSRIGDAMPIMMSPLPMGGPKALPDDLKEKAVSPTVAMIRAVAQRKGHDPKLAEAMVRAEFEYKIGDKMICPAGQLLTLTAQDAEQIIGEGDNAHPLLSAGTVNSIEDLLKTIGNGSDKIITLKPTAAEKLARIIDGFPISGILLALGLLGLYIEYKTPGFGIPGISGILILAIWFWGHHIAGVANILEISIFTIGIILLLIEIFIIPGFGVAGIAGTALIFASLFMSMLGKPLSSPHWYTLPSLEDIHHAVLNFSMAIILTLIGGVILAKLLPKSAVFQRLRLDTAENKADGYSAATKSSELLIGTHGIAATQLRPSGIGEFNDKRLDVIARGSFIEKSTAIVIAEVHGNRIIVDKV